MRSSGHDVKDTLARDTFYEIRYGPEGPPESPYPRGFFVSRGLNPALAINEIKDMLVRRTV